MAPITSFRDQVRLEIGDTETAHALFTDEEIDVYIDRHGERILIVAAALCDVLSRRYARAYDFETDGQKFSRSQMSKQYAGLATELRQRASGVESNPTTRIDGYSSEIAYDEVDADERVGRARIGWVSPDLPA